MFVVTLVHGTWGRGFFRPSGDAPWTRDDSAFVSALRRRLDPGAGVRFRRFPWSGRNTHTARNDAANRLCRFLDDGFRDPRYGPDAKHVIVAHSHGGNVALSALAHPAVRDRIAGVACLATPFIWVRERDLGRNGLETVSAALLAPVVLLLWALNRYLPQTWAGPVRFALVTLIGSLAAGSFALVVRSLLRHAKTLRAQLSPNPPLRDRLLIVRSPADEAAGALGLAQFIAQVSVRLFLYPQALQAALEGRVKALGERRARVLVFGFVAFVASFVPLILLAAASKAGAPPWLAQVAVAAWAGLLTVFAGAIYLALLGPQYVTTPSRLIVAALLWPLVLILSVLMLPFGWQAAAANVLLDVVVESTPVGRWETYLLEPPSSEELGTPVPPLMHGVHQNPRAHELVGRWIEGLRAR